MKNKPFLNVNDLNPWNKRNPESLMTICRHIWSNQLNGQVTVRVKSALNRNSKVMAKSLSLGSCQGLVDEVCYAKAQFDDSCIHSTAIYERLAVCQLQLWMRSKDTISKTPALLDLYLVEGVGNR